MSKKKEASNPRFHYEIWKGPSDEFGNHRKSIYYVENHNAPCGYAELAVDFAMAADLLIEKYRMSKLGNWMAPVSHMSRQVIELHLKALMKSIHAVDNKFDTKYMGTHNLERIWFDCRDWLVNNGYDLNIDARLDMTENIISAFHEIDPSGDLFRFGISNRVAFDKQKSYDRVGICIDSFDMEFNAARGLLQHWEVTLFRQCLKLEMGWDKDPYFDAENFPKIK
ncbi:hypothetical protein [Vibrio cholerae]|uniref:hypothetical protein n=1 Tax=Vibrio cholerae TaxID=666 RepID=UPI000E0CBA62|nr:hypothetical protein [Vibrio cholerae]HDI3164406.1 hypothetical protein [Vibrio cholerae]